MGQPAGVTGQTCTRPVKNPYPHDGYGSTHRLETKHPWVYPSQVYPTGTRLRRRLGRAGVDTLPPPPPPRHGICHSVSSSSSSSWHWCWSWVVCARGGGRGRHRACVRAALRGGGDSGPRRRRACVHTALEGGDGGPRHRRRRRPSVVHGQGLWLVLSPSTMLVVAVAVVVVVGVVMLMVGGVVADIRDRGRGQCGG